MGVYRVDFLGWIGRDNWHTQSSAGYGYGVPRGDTMPSLLGPSGLLPSSATASGLRRLGHRVRGNGKGGL
jgi:hypothetical protein